MVTSDVPPGPRPAITSANTPLLSVSPAASLAPFEVPGNGLYLSNNSPPTRPSASESVKILTVADPASRATMISAPAVPAPDIFPTATFNPLEYVPNGVKPSSVGLSDTARSASESVNTLTVPWTPGPVAAINSSPARLFVLPIARRVPPANAPNGLRVSTRLSENLPSRLVSE